MKHEIIIKGIEDLERAAAEFLEKIGDNTLVAFFAPMGSGKTTFTTALCRVLGVTDPVGSPTFAIVNEYETGEGETVFHFDFYRIKSLAEVYNMGYEEYLYSNAYCFIEWPELIEELLPEETVRVEINEENDGTRTIKVKYND